jgi:hypothetical protein
LLFSLGVRREQAKSQRSRRPAGERARRKTPQASGAAIARVIESSPRGTRRVRRLAPVVLAGLAAVLASRADATIVGGGGSRTTDCLAVFNAEANTPARRPKHVRCADGDICDADGMVNGRCDFPVAVCANSTAIERCEIAGLDSLRIEHALDNGDRDFDPDFQALQARVDGDFDFPVLDPNVCTLTSVIQVTVRGPFRNHRCKKGEKRLRMVAGSTRGDDGRFKIDEDLLKLTCDPAPAGCDPRALFDGTFDRVQRQIFDQSCALSGCHDSQSVAGELLLETGAAHANIVNVTPTNDAAANAGLQRVSVPTEGTGDPANSYLLMKVTGDLPPAYGPRMPFGGKKLDRTLIDVIQLWIAAGAPDEGWVPGTD